MKTLIVGCGLRPKPDCVNLDMFPLPGVDVVFNLDDIGKPKGHPTPACLPFKDNEFERIEAEDVLEHVEDLVAVVQELGRILKPGGTLWVRGPDGRYPEQLWADPTHRRAFAKRSFDNFDPETHDGKHYGHYFGPIKFKVIEVKEKNMGYEYTLVKR